MARKNSKITIKDLLKRYSDAKVGEILVTSIRKDGTLKGVDEELIEICSSFQDVPIIYSGGLVFEDSQKLKNYDLDAVTISSSVYFKNFNLEKFRGSFN